MVYIRYNKNYKKELVLMLTNVIALETKNMNHDIELFLTSKARRSENTAKMYKSHIKEFLSFLNIEETDKLQKFQSVKHMNVLQYVGMLEDKGNSAQTIGTKLAALKSLWKHFSKDYDINPSIWDVDLLKEENSHPEFTSEEFELFLDFCLEQQCKGLEKKLYFETLYVTGLRKTAVLEMKWSDVNKVKDISGDDVWVIKVRDKGNKFDEVPISDEFYEKLTYIKTDSENIFQFNEKTLYKVISQFKEKYGIEKKLTIHSIKSTSVTDSWRRTKDIKKVQEHGHHSDPSLTIRKYVRAETSLKDKMSYRMDSKVETRTLENLSKEELLSLISRSSDNTKNELLQLLG